MDIMTIILGTFFVGYGIFTVIMLANTTDLFSNSNGGFMKYFIPFILIIMLFPGCSSSKNERLDLRQLFSFNYERQKNPNPEQLSIIRYILKYTYENNIHKMRGETENVVYVREDGSEAVFDKDGNLVTNSYNMGSFNYYSNETEPIKKFIFDIAPWLLWGNTQDDPTTFNERLYYYTLDLDYGIQSYIFEGSKETLAIVPFGKLSKNEKEVYHIFIKLIFNEDYDIKLKHENIQNLREDGNYYWEYFYQIQEMLNVKQ